MKDRVHQYRYVNQATHGTNEVNILTRVRNPDLLTSLDVLSTGQYTRFPTVHQVRADLCMSPQWTRKDI